jgi:PAS domain S-box-containing protein
MSDTTAEQPHDKIDQADGQDLWSALVESETRLRALVAATAVLVICTDDQLRITEFNPAAERVFERRRADVLGERYSDLLPITLRRKVDRDFQRVIEGGSIRLFENVLLDSQGHTTVVLWDVQRVSDADGRGIGVVAVGHDITARQRPQELKRR